MSLIDCLPTKVDGWVLPGAPEVTIRRNVLYVPRADGGADTEFGLFDETGRQILSNALFHDSPSHLKSQRITTGFARSSFRPHIGNAIYCGAISNHYGHFITECFNTLWYFVAYGTREDRLIFHSDLSTEQIWNTTWIVDFLRYAGVQREQVVVPRAPTTVGRLILPGQAFCEDSFVYEAYKTCADHIGNAARAECIELPDRPIYLSRMNVRQGTRRLVNEDALAAEFARRGVCIVSPEKLPVCEQIALFTQPVLGVIGSAFHASIFSRGVRGVALCPESGQGRRSYLLMDAANRARISYVHETNQRSAFSEPDFSGAFALADPVATAEAMLDRLDSILGTTSTTQSIPSSPNITIGDIDV